MAFFTDKSKFTHKGSFYFIPVYLNLDSSVPIISGTNIVFDYLLIMMTYFHNYVVELISQLIAYIFNFEYESGFVFKITEEL